MTKLNLWGLCRHEFHDLMRSWGQADYRADQIFQWLYKRLVLSPAEMTNLPVQLRKRLSEETSLNYPALGQRYYSPAANAVKLLFTLPDRQSVEGVLLKYRSWFSACVSSQAGCRMGCAFCASTIGGLDRNLTVAEITGQLVHLAREANQLGGDVRGLVLMGIGEPLDNYENVLKFLNLITDPDGFDISYRRITLSTCGLVPGILRLAREKLPLTLAVSLHAPTDDLRNKLVPVNKAYPLSELMAACREYTKLTGRRLTFEYVLLGQVNDSLAQAHQLADLVGRLPSHVNLIPFNPVTGSNFDPPEPGRVKAFYAALRACGISATVRRELGQDIGAACGQLRRRELENRM